MDIERRPAPTWLRLIEFADRSDWQALAGMRREIGATRPDGVELLTTE